jgi:phosphoribosylanthranilate isomerase
MNRISIKFCGFRTVDDVRKATDLQVDLIGFVLAPGRRRSVDPDILQEMASTAGFERSVGVLVNPTIDEIRRWLDLAPLGTIQLCGRETPEFCREVKRRFGLRIIKVFHVSETEDEDGFWPEAYAPWVDVALLDAASQEGGGTGTRFDWRKIPALRKRCRKLGLPLWVAGGLTPENVEELVTSYHPDGVDVSSGIELDGSKSRERMERFVERVRRCESKGD